MYLKINPHNPQERKLQQAVDCLRRDGLIIYPTDTVYGLGCNIRSKKAVERLCRLKGIDPVKANLTFICEDLKILGQYAAQIDTSAYKLMRKALPGPYTFILRASKLVPRHFQSKKKTVGIRVSEHKIPSRLAQLLGNPIASLSLPADEEEPYAHTDPEWMYERFQKQVDIVIDGGIGGLEPSTILDVSRGENEWEVIRKGAGDLASLGIEIDETE